MGFHWILIHFAQDYMLYSISHASNAVKAFPRKMGIQKNQHRDFSAAKARDDFSKANHGDMGLPGVG